MNKKEIDETTVVADMSYFDHRTKRNNVVSEQKQPKELIRGRQLIPFIKGTLAAAFLMLMIYVVVYGIVIGIMYLLFQNVK